MDVEKLYVFINVNVYVCVGIYGFKKLKYFMMFCSEFNIL